MQVKKQQLKLDLKQRSGSKLGKEYVKAVYHHPAYLTYMQSTLGEGNGTPLQYCCPEKSHGWRSLVGCSPWGRTELDTTEATWQQYIMRNDGTGCHDLSFLNVEL